MSAIRDPIARGLHHVSLRVSNLEQALAFYRDALGSAAAASFTIDGRRFMLLAAGDGGYVELAETPAAPVPAAGRDAIAHFALRVTDLEAAVDAVRLAGREILVPPVAREMHDIASGRSLSVRVAFVRGPDGEIVELFEERPPDD